MVLKNAAIASFGAEELTRDRDICIDGEYFSDSGSGDVIDCAGLTAIPGLIDLHMHGCVGRDFCDADVESIHKISDYLAAHGITAFNPATMTLPEDELLEICTSAHEFKALQEQNEYEGSSILTGITMEGPFLNPEKMGAQSAKYMCNPDISLLRQIQKASGDLVKITCVAPELPGAMEYIAEASKNCVVALAHTSSDYDTAVSAFKHGAKHVTHLFDAMSPFHHRAPGVVGAAFDSGAHVELICDGVHLHPTSIKAAVKLYGDDRCVMVSDSMMATGLGDGIYSLGGNTVSVASGKAHLSDGTIAGSTSNLMDCMRYMVSIGIPLISALKMCTINPARILGVDGLMGSISPGKYANMVLIDAGFNVKSVYIKGREVVSA
ncbi:MAG: N-acetylglucosamine-6-phosphate deacetylase [Oscillospiraceae bacterium]|jgi:N-acetylglucosamine-6-phosphate deacetylase|nr:N-acetylglucosamine-6-phosphate deacetylase [Oscillospiraceae bacterium]